MCGVSSVGPDRREGATSAATAAAVPGIVDATGEHGVTDVHWFLAYYGYPVIWLVTASDEEKAEVKGRGLLRAEVLAALGDAGVAPDLVERTVVGVESQETVDRDFEGNWYYAMK